MSLTQRFRNARSGAIAPMFAFSFIALAGAVGVAIDYGRAHNMSQKMQAQLDAATLAAAKSSVLKDENPDAAVKAAIDASGIRDEVNITSVSASKDTNGVVSAEMTGNISTTLMNIVGIKTVELRARSAVMLGTGNLEIALVLDTTGSMAGSKLDALKSAATSLVDTLFAIPYADQNVKVAVVPFATYVNVGLGNRNASWIDVPAEYSETNNYCSTTKPVLSKSGCTTATSTYMSDGFPQTHTYETCSNITYGPETTTCNDHTTNYTWKGCVGSCNNPLNTQDVGYGSKVPGLLNTNCPGEITPLTNDKDTVKSAISGMWANGETYIPAGLVWGWRVVSDKAPYDEAAADASKPDRRKYVVLMTDGTNTRSATFPKHDGSDTAAANTVTAELCANMKNDKIEIFTIAFSVTDPTIKSLLESCASPGGAYYHAIDESKLLAAIKDIGDSLVQMRLDR